MTEPGAVVYIRVSRVGDRDRGSTSYQTEAVQQERCEAYAAAKGLPVVGVFSDIDVSGGKWDRAGLDAALAELDAGRASTLIVYRLSRLGRGLRGVLATVDRIRKAGGSVASVMEGLDLSTAAGRMQFNILASIDEYERELRGEYWDATRARVEARGVLVGPTPIGYARDEESRLVVDERTREAMRAVFAARAEGSSFLDVAGMLDAIRPSRSGRPRLAHAASIVIRNPVYRGQLPRGGDCPAIVTEDEWEAAQLTPQARRGNERFYLLTGIAKCAGCGGPMVGGGRGGKTSAAVYQCRNASRPEPERCGSPATINAGNLERWVISQAAGWEVKMTRATDAELAAMDRAAREADEALARHLRDAPTRIRLTDDEWQMLTDALIDERDRTRERAAGARMMGQADLTRVRDRPELLARYLGGFVRSLTVRRGRNLSVSERCDIDF